MKIYHIFERLDTPSDLGDSLQASAVLSEVENIPDLQYEVYTCFVRGIGPRMVCLLYGQKMASEKRNTAE